MQIIILYLKKNPDIALTVFYLNVNVEKVKVGIEQCANIHT